MRTRALQLADMEYSDYIDTAELKDIVNEQCQALWDLLLASRGHEYYAEEKSFTTTASKSLYPLPGDFYQSTIFTIDDGNYVRNLETFEEQEIAQLKAYELATAQNFYNIKYRIRGSNVELRPTPQTTGWVVTVRYVPVMPRLVKNSDSFDGINGWEKWAELGAAVEMLVKEESDPGPMKSEQARVEARIRALAPTRDAGRPARIVDTRGDWAGIELLDDWNV